MLSIANAVAMESKTPEPKKSASEQMLDAINRLIARLNAVPSWREARVSNLVAAMDLDGMLSEPSGKVTPEADIAFIVLLVFQESSQGRGFGPQALRLAEAIGISWLCRASRIAVIDKHPRALAFWEHEGFVGILRKPAMDYAGHHPLLAF